MIEKIKLIINEIWGKYFSKVQGDKHWHYELSHHCFFTLMLIGIVLNLWSWVPIFLAELGAFGKECYDWKLGKEKKFDKRDLLADQIGFTTAWIELQFAIWVIVWFYRFLN